MRPVALPALLTGLLLSLAPSDGSAQQTLTLANGDQLTGELVGIDGGTWVFKYGGADVKIAAADVTAFTAPEPVGFRLADGTLLAATVTNVAGGLRLQDADGTARTVPVADLAAAGPPDALEALRPIEVRALSPFFKFWHITTSLGFSVRNGNTNLRGGSFYLDMVRATDVDRLSLIVKATQNYDRVTTSGAPDSGQIVQIAGNYLAGLRYDIFVGNKLFAFGSTKQSRDRFKDIDLRSFYNAGLGYQFLATDKVDLRSSLGAGMRYEKFTTDSTSTVPVGSLDGGLRAVVGPFDYDLRTVYSPSFEQFSDYQLLTITGLTAKVIAGLGFRIQLTWEYDNEPAPGTAKSDTELSTALTYTLGS